MRTRLMRVNESKTQEDIEAVDNMNAEREDSEKHHDEKALVGLFTALRGQKCK